MTRLPPTLMFILISLPRWGSLIFLRWLGEASVAFLHELLAGGWILPAAHATVTVKGQGQNCIFFLNRQGQGASAQRMSSAAGTLTSSCSPGGWGHPSQSTRAMEGGPRCGALRPMAPEGPLLPSRSGRPLLSPGW